MSKTADFLITCVEHAGWPLEAMPLACDIGEDVGYVNLADELCTRAEHACDGWQQCLIANEDERQPLCQPCPLTTRRDHHSDELEGRL